MFLRNQIDHAMRSLLGLFIVTTSVVMLSSCGGGTKESKQQETPVDTSSSTYSPSASSTAYDPTKIDPNAPVMEKSLEAVGNSMDVMSFSVQEIRVKAGTTVKIHFSNTAKDPALKHNFFIVKKGTKEQVATAALNAGAEKNFVPDDKTNVLYTSGLLDAGKSEDLVFPAPPVGEYEFVCTYPGHWQKMNGKFIVE